MLFCIVQHTLRLLRTGFDDAIVNLVNVLRGDQSSLEEGAPLVETAGIDGYAEIPFLPDETLLWSEEGYYWYKNWRNLTRVKLLATTMRLIFAWDTRDMWKWKAHEEEELSATFPIMISLSEIGHIGQVQKPKIMGILPTSTPYVEMTTHENSIHKFTLSQIFEQRVEQIRELLIKNG